MARKSVGMFGLDWEDITDFAQKTNKTRVYLDELKKEWIYWFDGGGALTKRVAEDCADFIRSEIYSQNAFEGMPDISETWRTIKAHLGLSQEIGIATGDMASSIKAVNQRYSRWKVGISEREHSISYGTINSVYQYAKLLEYGYGPVVGSDGKVYYQPPRPFFSKSFLQWAQRALPKKIFNTIYKNMYDKLLDIYEEVGDTMPHFEPEDLYTTDYAGEGASDAQQVFQESTERGTGYPEDIESSELNVGDPGVVGRSTEGESGTFADEDYGSSFRNYPESERTEKMRDTGGIFQTSSGDIWNEQEQMWQDMDTYYKKMYGGNL